MNGNLHQSSITSVDNVWMVAVLNDTALVRKFTATWRHVALPDNVQKLVDNVIYEWILIVMIVCFYRRCFFIV